MILQQFEVVFFFPFFLFCPFSTHVRTNFLFCVFSIFSSALSHSRIWEGLGLRLLGGLHWQRHSGDGRLFHGVMQFSGAVRRRGYGVLKPRRVKHQGFPGGWSEEKKLLLYRRKAKKTRYDFDKVKGTLRALEMGCVKTDWLDSWAPAADFFFFKAKQATQGVEDFGNIWKENEGEKKRNPERMELILRPFRKDIAAKNDLCNAFFVTSFFFFTLFFLLC